MKPAAKRGRAGENRLPDRAWLVAAARTAFGDLGPGASIEEIARSAGISAETLSRQFRDRDELVVAVLDDLVTSLGGDDAPEPVFRWPAAGLRVPRLNLRRTVTPLAAMAALLPLGATPTAAAADEPTPVTVLTVTPLWPVIPLDDALGGSLCEPRSCTPVPYKPFWTADGVRALDSRLSPAADAPTIVFAFSNGAMVAAKWLTEHADDPGAPSPDELSFVLIGNPRRTYGGSSTAMPPTEYHVVDIVRQYDPKADFPDHPNLLALANIAGGVLSPMHLDYTGVDIDDPANTVWTEGNTTYVFVPTENLPLLAPLRLIGMGGLADALNEPLKEIVERAYDRPYLASAEAASPQTETGSAPSAAAVTHRAVAVKEDTTRPVLRKKGPGRRSDDETVDLTDGDAVPHGKASTTHPSDHASEVSDDRQQPAAGSTGRLGGETSEGQDAAANAASRVGKATPAQQRGRHRGE
ncbi:MAG TPA: PE-PPE domain-containing protein [Mycobacterium sp.]|nr:PE-PPE domain-containing protein [Mycobacterium sp.]